MPTIQGPQATIREKQVRVGPHRVWVSGGGGLADDWYTGHTPCIKDGFRDATVDDRGIRATRCDALDAFVKGLIERCVEGGRR